MDAAESSCQSTYSTSFLVLGLVLVVLAIAGLAIKVSEFGVVRMDSNSMQPANTRGSIQQGNLALVKKNRWAPLRTGDLVVVELSNNGKQMLTIRRVAGIPGDSIPDMFQGTHRKTIPNGFYYVLGDSTNAVDSRQLGLLRSNVIRGKVVYVIK